MGYDRTIMQRHVQVEFFSLAFLQKRKNISTENENIMFGTSHLSWFQSERSDANTQIKCMGCVPSFNISFLGNTVHCNITVYGSKLSVLLFNYLWTCTFKGVNTWSGLSLHSLPLHLSLPPSSDKQGDQSHSRHQAGRKPQYKHISHTAGFNRHAYTQAFH